jgi:hypothetical protein
MLRKAVIQRISGQVSALGGRVYEESLAPGDATRPYATVKLATSARVEEDPFTSYQPIEVRIYGDRTSFGPLDEIEQSVVAALDGAEVTDSGDGSTHLLHWGPGGGDFSDEAKQLIGRLTVFATAIVVKTEV